MCSKKCNGMEIFIWNTYSVFFYHRAETSIDNLRGDIADYNCAKVGRHGWKYHHTNNERVENILKNQESKCPVPISATVLRIFLCHLRCEQRTLDTFIILCRCSQLPSPTRHTPPWLRLFRVQIASVTSRGMQRPCLMDSSSPCPPDNEEMALYLQAPGQQTPWLNILEGSTEVFTIF